MIAPICSRFHAPVKCRLLQSVILRICDNQRLFVVIARFLGFTQHVTNRNDSRSALAEALKRALAGQHDPARLHETISSPHSLSLLEKSAWLQLQNWSTDEQLRTQFVRHAEFSRRRLKELITRLED